MTSLELYAQNSSAKLAFLTMMIAALYTSGKIPLFQFTSDF